MFCLKIKRLLNLKLLFRKKRVFGLNVNIFLTKFKQVLYYKRLNILNKIFYKDLNKNVIYASIYCIIKVEKRFAVEPSPDGQ
jgi:hypothetical protein